MIPGQANLGSMAFGVRHERRTSCMIGVSSIRIPNVQYHRFTVPATIFSASFFPPPRFPPPSTNHLTTQQPCCVCKDEKASRDECMLFSNSENPQEACQSAVERYRSCMKGFGFQIA